MNLSKEKIVFISGIGCSSRFPYYMNTYGIHSIHGRAPTLATGLKLVRPDLSIWIITGDGDCLSIGGNHILHLLRRNINVNVLLFNNRIYGLTKGQYSPTSLFGKITKSTPFGSIDRPLNPISFALGADASFVARSLDTDTKMLINIIKEAYNHNGTSFIEIYQNCLVFNDGEFSKLTNKKIKNSNSLILRNKKALLFDDNRKGLFFNNKTLSTEIIDLKKYPDKLSKILLHNESNSNRVLATMLSLLDNPVPLGIFRKVNTTVYEEMVNSKHQKLAKKYANISLDELLSGNDSWIID
jgi:2-oxoglutarate ferredoxin oxidoreductase subunit beta